MKATSQTYFIAINRSGYPVPSWMRYLRSDVVRAITSELSCEGHPYTWKQAKKEGFRIEKVTIQPAP